MSAAALRSTRHAGSSPSPEAPVDELTVAGVDGCRGGWAVILRTTDEALGGRERRRRFAVLENFEALLEHCHAAAVIAVDIPIGLLSAAVPGGRRCCQMARRRLGPRASSVFSPPVRSALAAVSYPDALVRQRASSAHQLGLSKQCYFLFPKIREVDAALTPAWQHRVREVHPELCFSELAGHPMADPKRTPGGRHQRLRALGGAGFRNLRRQVETRRGPSLAADDILDACVAAWSARRIARAEALRLPSEPPRDARGLAMEILA